MHFNQSTRHSVSPRAMESSSNVMLNTVLVHASQPFANGVAIQWNHGASESVVPLEMRRAVMMTWISRKKFLCLISAMRTIKTSSRAATRAPNSEEVKFDLNLKFLTSFLCMKYYSQIKPSQSSSHVRQRPLCSRSQSHVPWWCSFIFAHYSVTTRKNGCHLQKWCRRFFTLKKSFFFLSATQQIQLNSIYSIYSEVIKLNFFSQQVEREMW